MKFFVIFFLAFNLSAQIGVGDWRLHVSNNSAIDVVAGNDVVYTAFKNGLLEYDLTSTETSLWTDVNALSDVSLTCLEFYTAQNALFIGYENGNIDKISDNKVLNIPAIRLAQVQGSKKINKIQVFNNLIYVSTGFSIVILDPVKNEVIDTYYPTNGDTPIMDVSFRNDSIFALSETKLYRGYLNNPSLADPAQWVVDSRLPIVSGILFYKDIELINSELFVLKSDPINHLDSAFHLKNSGLSLVNDLSFSLQIRSLENLNDKLALNLGSGIFIYSSDFSSYSIETNIYIQDAVVSNSFAYGGSIWVADQNSGLIKHSNGINTKITFEGPPRDSFFSLDCAKGKLAIASGGREGNQMTYNRTGIYLFDDEKWSLVQSDNQSFLNGKSVWDFLCVAVNPTDKNQVAMGSYSYEGICMIKDGSTVSETFNTDNSPLQGTMWHPEPLISKLKYDNQGNLWVGNSFCTNPLKVYTKDHVWQVMNLGSSVMNQAINALAVDYNGNKWMAVLGVGIIAINDNGTITDTSDDKIKILNTGENSGALPSNDVKSIAVDFDNNIWIGTDNGFAILYNSANIFEATAGNYNAQRIKLDVLGDIEYLLGSTFVVDIEVDGGNRKWIGTDNAGVFLLSPDGSEIISNFTTENSPLISNNIEDMVFDQSTGELFIITDKGLISYRTDATFEDPEYSDVKVFPNPAKADFEGPITIQGIKYDSDVHVTDVAGNLVYKTTSNGGTATWNGKTLTGEKVKTGVYLFWTAPNETETKGRKVGKVVVIN